MPRPFTVEGRSGHVDLDTAIFLAISGERTTRVYLARLSRCHNVFKAAQQGLLVVLDLNDEVIAGLTSDLECFFGNALRRA